MHYQNTENVSAYKEESSSNVCSTSKSYLILKSIFDSVASFCASIILVIPMMFIAFVIMLKDWGSPFYTQRRIGQDGREIKILKFRSMRCGADQLEEMLTPEQIEEYKREYKLKDDPRLIGYRKTGDGNKCFGAVLRQTSIDEIPQIVYNIFLKKDMSFVGPRPILQEELAENYSEEEIQQLLSVKPGLTGYWQAYARNCATYKTGERQQMELFYVANRSVWLDLKILFRTVITVLKKMGAE